MAIRKLGKGDKAPVNEEQEQTTATAPVSKKTVKRSFADQFDEAKGGGNFMPPGKHEVYITGLEWEGDADPEGEGKLAAKVTYTGAPDEEDGVAEKNLSQWYQCRTEDGDIGKGIGFLKADLAKLGYEDAKFADMEEIFEEVVNEKPRVSITVKVNGQFTNAYLNGVVDTE